jgi:hypothetical protein
MTVAEYTRLKLVVESLRFPVLATLDGAPEMRSVPVLARLGFAGLVLPGAGVGPEALGAQVTALREELERTPITHEGSESALLGGLVGMQGGAAEPQRERVTLVDVMGRWCGHPSIHLTAHLAFSPEPLKARCVLCSPDALSIVLSLSGYDTLGWV